MADAYDERDRRHRSPRHYDRDRREHRDRGDDRYKRDDRRDDRRPHRDRDDRYRDEPRDRRRHDEDRGGYRRDSFRESRDDRRRDRHASNDRRSPTPPNSVPLSQRRRKASGWDVTAPGYEQYSAMQAKQTGLFNLPGANRSHGPQIIGFTGAHPPVATGMVSNSNLARQSRRLYLGSITPLADEESIALFFNSQMRERKLTTSSAPPVLAVQVNREKNYAFVEFRSAEDATAGMALDGTVFLDGPLRVRRPHDYAGPEAMTGVAGFATLLPATMPDSVNKIFIGNLPTHLTEDQIVELLKSFGELKAFNLVREHGTNVSKGFAFVEYADPAVTDIATESLNGMDLGDKKLVVQRASVGAKGGVPIPPEAMDIPAPIVAVDLNKEANGRVVLMLNMVVAEDLMDDVEYEEILDDIRSECSGFGQVLGVYVPRPLKKDKSRWDTMDPNTMSPAEIAKADEIAGVGRVYVKFSDTEGATTAVRQLAGRSFAGRTIITTLMREDDPDVQRVFPNA